MHSSFGCDDRKFKMLTSSSRMLVEEQMIKLRYVMRRVAVG